MRARHTLFGGPHDGATITADPHTHPRIWLPAPTGGPPPRLAPAPVRLDVDDVEYEWEADPGLYAYVIHTHREPA